jgi:hypothetical protein
MSIENKFILDKVIVSLLPVGQDTEDTLPIGWYTIGVIASPGGNRIKILQYEKEEPMLPRSADLVARHYMGGFTIFDKYFSTKSESFHKKINMIRKLGVLFYGPQGTAKTTTMYAIAKHILKTVDARVFVINESSDYDLCMSMIKASRRNKENTIINVFIFDECEGAMFHKEGTMKRILDGDPDFNNSLFLFATNYVEKIPNAIQDRPSRIKYKIYMGDLTEEEELLIYESLKDMNEALPKLIILLLQSSLPYKSYI